MRNPNQPKHQAAISTRKSYGEDQPEVLTLYKQRKACITYLTDHPELGLGYLETKYMDKDAKGHTIERDAFVSLLLCALKPQFDVVMVHSLNRLTTSAGSLRLLVGFFAIYGIRVFSVKDQRFISPQLVHDLDEAHRLIRSIVDPINWTKGQDRGKVAEQ